MNANQRNTRIPGESEGLNVFMMGAVMVEYNRKPLSITINPLGEALQFFLILLYAGEKGVLREELLDMLYGNDENTNPLGSLEAVMFRLRKILEGSGLPEHECIRTKDGVYRFDKSSLSAYMGIKDFEETTRKALKTRDEDLLEKTYRLYQGEFTVQLAGEKQVSAIEVRCRELYFRCLRVASHLAEANRGCAGLLELCSTACNLYPHEKCQITKIDCLITMKHFKDAIQAYGQTVAQYSREQSLPPSERMLEWSRTMSDQIRCISDTLKDVGESLQERDQANGPYHCSYPVFIDCYRLSVRMSERIGLTSVMLCCTLLDAKGKPLDAVGDSPKTASARLHEAIGASVKKRDLFTCYNPSQYLITLSGTSQEYRLRILKRMNRTLHLWDGERKVRLNYQVMPKGLL